jgi:hypothetical protein
MSGHTEHWLKSEVCEIGRFPLADDLANFCGSSFMDSLARIRIFLEAGRLEQCTYNQFEYSIQVSPLRRSA